MTAGRPRAILDIAADGREEACVSACNSFLKELVSPKRAKTSETTFHSPSKDNPSPYCRRFDSTARVVVDFFSRPSYLFDGAPMFPNVLQHLSTLGDTRVCVLFRNSKKPSVYLEPDPMSPLPASPGGPQDAAPSTTDKPRKRKPDQTDWVSGFAYKMDRASRSWINSCQPDPIFYLLHVKLGANARIKTVGIVLTPPGEPRKRQVKAQPQPSISSTAATVAPPTAGANATEDCTDAVDEEFDDVDG